MVRKALFFTSFSLAAAVQAKPVFFGQLQSEFPQAKLSLRCNVCHTGGPQLNAFGKEFAKTKSKFDNSAEIWQSLRKGDADKDGMTNEDEIESGRNPGKAN